MRTLFLLTTLAGASGLCACDGERGSSMGKQTYGEPPPVFTTPAWNAAGSLTVRVDDATLLLRHSARETLYRFRPAGSGDPAALTAEREGAWAQAAGPVESCDRQSGATYARLRVEGNTVRTNDGSVRARGSVITSVALSPQQRHLAMVSGKRRVPELLPFMGGTASGLHLHQTVSWPGLDPGPRVPLGMGGRNEPLTACWSPDGRYVIYTNPLFHRLTLVTVDR